MLISETSQSDEYKRGYSQGRKDGRRGQYNPPGLFQMPPVLEPPYFAPENWWRDWKVDCEVDRYTNVCFAQLHNAFMEGYKKGFTESM